MKKIINGKKYNTETVKLVGVYSNGRSHRDIVIKVDKVVNDFDPYEYDDSECSIEKLKDLIEENPLQVIEMLADMLEEVLI